MNEQLQKAKDNVIKATKAAWGNKTWIDMEDEEDGNGCIISGDTLTDLENALKELKVQEGEENEKG